MRPPGPPDPASGPPRTSSPKMPAQLDPARVVGGDDGGPAGQGLEGHRGRRLQDRGQHEEVGRRPEGGHLLVGHQAQEAHGLAEAERPRPGP